MKRRTSRKPGRTRKTGAKPADRKPRRPRKSGTGPPDRKPGRTRKPGAKPAARKPQRARKPGPKPAERKPRRTELAGRSERRARPLTAAPPEVLDYISWAAAQSASIRRAIARARTFRSRLDISEDLARQLTVEIAALEARLSRNEAEIDAAQAEGGTPAPPTPEDVQAVARLVMRLDREITDAEVARAVLGASSAILEAVAQARRGG
jgi:hypothetical protein